MILPINTWKRFTFNRLRTRLRRLYKNEPYSWGAKNLVSSDSVRIFYYKANLYQIRKLEIAELERQWKVLIRFVLLEFTSGKIYTFKLKYHSNLANKMFRFGNSIPVCVQYLLKDILSRFKWYKPRLFIFQTGWDITMWSWNPEKASKIYTIVKYNFAPRAVLSKSCT